MENASRRTRIQKELGEHVNIRKKNTQFVGKKNFSRATKKVTSPSPAKSKDKYMGMGQNPLPYFGE
jgi:hypothetical protein